MFETQIKIISIIIGFGFMLCGCTNYALQDPPPEKSINNATIPTKFDENVVPYDQIRNTVENLKSDANAQEITDTIITLRTLKVSSEDMPKVAQVETELLLRLRGTLKSQQPSYPETEKLTTYEEIYGFIGQLKNDSTAQEIADTISNISEFKFLEEDREKVDQLQSELLTRLRDKVKSEILAYNEAALKASTYRIGLEKARQADSILALYPLSDDPAIIKEAGELSLGHNEVLQRLELIRRQRYNHWAAEQAEKALKELRENGKEGSDKAIKHLKAIEPSLLESSVASLYAYVVTEIVDEFKNNEKASVAIKLTDTSVNRRNLEEF